MPDAWIFRSDTPSPRGKDDPANGKDADKFIFYRGAGNSAPLYRVQSDSDGTLRFMHWGQGGAVDAAFALTVQDGMAHWSRLPRLEATIEDRPETHFDHVTATVGGTPLPVDKAVAQLTNAMREALVNAGLTADEARAMVATWDSHWFRESGTRVLAIMPRAWVDLVLPLTVTPQPRKLERVFVARFEVLTQEREEALLTLLNERAEPRPGSVHAARYTQLDTGRFTQGALLRAQPMQVQRMAAPMELLRRATAQPDAVTATTAVR